MFNLHVYVLHATSLASRKKLCDELHSKLTHAMSENIFKTVQFEYIESHDISKIDNATVQKYVDLTKGPVASAFDSLLKGLHIRQLSNALKHYEAIQKVALSDENTFSLIIEDDVVYSDNVVERLVKILKALENAKDSWDVNFLGLPQPLNEDPESVRISPVESIFKILPDISSYVLTRKSAEKLLNVFLPVRFCTNVHLSYLYLEKAKDKLKFTMTTPNVFVDGSKFGVYLSSINPNNKLILNQDYSKLHNKIHSQTQFSDQNKQEINTTFETMSFNNHPEIQCLKGMFEMKIGNYETAKEIFDKCYQTYMNNDCLLNSESEFLQVYARVHKYLQ